MSAADSSAIKYVAYLCHRPRSGKPCFCERCTSIRRVVRLASDHVSLKRVAQYKQHATKNAGTKCV